MDSYIERSYRKNLKLNGLIYFGGQEQNITVKNLSITGLLAELSSDEKAPPDINDIFNTLKSSTIVDVFLPEMNLTGEVEVIRVDMVSNHILLALEFKNISFESDNFLYSRREYRKRMQGAGRILINGKYHDFKTVNVSVVGLMIQLNEKIDIEEGSITQFNFDQLDLNGEIKVIWVEHLADNLTLVGLQYLNMENTVIKGVPRFAR
ncbi:MAG: PilZ domain-containing protein [Gammaproteobacteria bacterium]